MSGPDASRTMDLADLCYSVNDGVARIAFNRPRTLNSLGGSTTQQLVQACTAAAADPAVRVLVITGEGEAFCSGGDFEDTFERGAGLSAAQWRDRIRQGPNALVRVLQGMAKPVVASINGIAVGGGATIALACDLRIASDRARFSLPFARLGLTPEFGCTHLLPRVVGLGKAMELLMLAETFDAAAAERIGLVNRVVPHETLQAATAQLVAGLLDKPAAALGAVKSLLHRGLTTACEAQLELEAVALGEAFTSQDHKNAVAAFLRRKAARGSAAPRA